MSVLCAFHSIRISQCRTFCVKELHLRHLLHLCYEFFELDFKTIECDELRLKFEILKKELENVEKSYKDKLDKIKLDSRRKDKNIEGLQKDLERLKRFLKENKKQD